MKKPINLIINLSTIRPPLTGIGHFTREITLRLLKNPDIKDIQAFHNFKWLKRDEILDFLTEIAKSKSKSRAPRPSFWQMELYFRALALFHARKFKNLSDYIYWESGYIPLLRHDKTIVTIYDLSFFRFPEFHPQARIQALSTHIPRAVGESSKILTISEFSKREIIDVFGVDEDKIALVSPGVDSRFCKKDEESCEKIRAKYGLPREFLLSVATVEPRKNFQGLCAAYARLSPALRARFPLVLVGAKGWLTDEIERLLTPLQESNTLYMLGYVPLEDLPYIYASASAFAYLSFYEGYGMPVAEAISCGIPVLTSDISSMPEVGGKDALFANPFNIDSIKDGLEKLLSAQKKEMDSSHLWSWEESSAKLGSLFGELLNKETNC